MPTDNKELSLDEKIRQLDQMLARIPSAVIAFSGGVDSTFLLARAKHIIHGRLLAVNAVSQFIPLKETEQANHLAMQLGIELQSFQVDVLSNTDILSNTKQRCYFCKKQIFSSIRQMAQAQGVNHLLHGVNADDLNDFRPGLEAAQELGFSSPLADVGLRKDQIREISRQMGLATWNKPSQSCLATRIPYGGRITVHKLEMIDRAEQSLYALGFEQVRVRHLGDMARVEVEPESVEKLLAPDVMHKVSQDLEKTGFKRIVIDKDGYRTGKMNQGI